MSEATTTSGETTSAAPVTPAAPAEPVALDAEDVAAIRAAGDGAPSAEPDTITIGGHTISVAELSALPDDVLRKIKRKIKSAGSEREISLLEALESVPKADGWQRKQWELAQERKRIAEQAQALPTNAIAAVMQLQGVSRAEAVDILAQQLVAELEEAELPPAERRERERRRALEERAAKADEYEREQQTAVQAKAQKAAQAGHLRHIGEAFAAVGVPQSDYNVARVATVLSGLYESGAINGNDAPSPEDYRWAAEQVAAEVRTDRKTAFADPVAFLKAHPEEARAIAKAYASSVRVKQAPPERAPGTAPRREAKTAGPKSFAEWQAEQNRRMAGR